jgi:hypothetical protein
LKLQAYHYPKLQHFEILKVTDRSFSSVNLIAHFSNYMFQLLPGFSENNPPGMAVPDL